MSHKQKKKTQAEIEREELTKAQVLNLKELETVANYERKTSKKPAAWLASIGIFAIALGIFYPSMTSMLGQSAANAREENVKVEPQKQKKVTTTSSSVNELTCSLTQPNVTDDTVSTITFAFNFKNDIIANYTKSIDIKTEGTATATPLSIVALDTSLTNLMQTPLVGYALEKKPIASTTPNVVDKYQALLAVDFTTFNKASLTVLHTSNYFATVEFEATDTKDIVQQKVITAGYACK